ncbi:MAG: tRNA (adenosine(37)-N6)-dimethylallyltransferase MiaA, partial [Bacteroidales bacterium]
MNIKNFKVPTLLVISGPTAVGKTEFAIQLAKQYKTVIISADSRQFYKEMRIGTAFPTPEELNSIPHFFVGNLSIQDYYSVSKYEQEVLQLLTDLFMKHEVVVMTGGSGLYIDAVCKGIDELPDPDAEVRKLVVDLFEKEGAEALRNQVRILDPEFYQNADIANYKRLMRALEVCWQTGKPYSWFLKQTQHVRHFDMAKYYLNRPREILFDRINKRVDVMMEQGLLDEVKTLYPYKCLNALNTVGYKELFDYLDHKM